MNESKSVIFLDIDGVLNGDETQLLNGYVFVDEDKIKRLARIVEATGAAIILSSDWRYDWETHEEFKNNHALRRELAKYGLKVEGITPVDEDNHWDMLARSREIKAYIEVCGIENFVILEDYWDMGDLDNHTVYTNESIGLTDENADWAIRILKGEI